MKVKICGITNPEDALFCERLGADYLGFVFYEKSMRYIMPDMAKSIIGKLSGLTKKVGVFVNRPPEIINILVHHLKLDFVQLHGDESPDVVSGIDAPVIKSFRIGDGFDFEIIKTYKKIYPLLDTFTSGQYGGTGRSFNWEIIPEELKEKIFLAGGISSVNVAEAYKNINPFAVDLSGSVESSAGKKDHIKLKEFFTALNFCKAEVRSAYLPGNKN